QGATLNVALQLQQITGLTTTPATKVNGSITALAFGNVAYVGTTDPSAPLLIRAAGPGSSFAKATGYTGATPVAITVDPRDANRAYILDSFGRVWVTLNGGATTRSFTRIGGLGATVAANLPDLPTPLSYGAITIIPTGAAAGSGEAVLVSNPPGTAGG